MDWRWLVVAGAAVAALLALHDGRTERDAATRPAVPTAAEPARLLRDAPAGAGLTQAPFTAAALQDRAQQLALAKTQLAQARLALANYEAAARYPQDSRPAREHPDQLHPFQPIESDHPLRTPGGTALQGVHLRTSQERVFASGNESCRVSLSLLDAQGQTLPLRITRSVLHEVTPPGQTAQTAERMLPMQDAGGVFSATIQPQLQGFGGFAGTLRLEVWMEYGGQPGFTYFDLIVSPAEAARWLPGVSEAVVDGSLQLGLRAEILMPGRYVVSARVDDAKGQPFALIGFNDELGRGTRTIPLRLHGRLLHDLQPAFPLRLRDVEAFLLLPDTFPDRVMLPRRIGEQHRTQGYALDRFSNEPWNGSERDRYMAELSKDVNQAQDLLTRLGGHP